MPKIEFIHDKPSKYSEKRVIPIILLIAAGLILLPLTFIPDKESIAALLCIIIAGYILIKPR